jgi:hypothetical protein
MIKLIKVQLIEIRNILKYGLHEYFSNQPELPITEIQEIYESINESFFIKWDIFYLILTLRNKNFTSFSRLILFISEYLRHCALVLQSVNYVYELEFDNSSNFLEAQFSFAHREDLYGDHRKKYFFIKKKSKLDLINTLISILPCFSFKKLFFKKLLWRARKYKKCQFPDKISVLEGRSIDGRALLWVAQERNIKSKVFWRKPLMYCYSKKRLLIRDNLDYPMELDRPLWKKNNIIPLSEKLTFKEKTLILLPTFNEFSRAHDWLDNLLKVVDLGSIAISIHPTYTHHMSNLPQNYLNFIDDDKKNYLNKYKNFIGLHSTLLVDAQNRDKVVISICFDRIALEYAEATLSGINIYDAQQLS